MIKTFLGYYKPHRRLLAMDLFAAVILSAVDLIFPMLSRQIIDVYIPEKNVQMIAQLAIIITALFIVRALCNYFINFWGHVMGARIERDMRSDLFKHFLTLPTRFFDEHKTGKLMSRLVNDLHEIAEMSHHVPEDFFISTLMIVGSFALLSTINLQLTLMLVVMVALLIGFAIYKRRGMLKAFRLQRENTASINAQIENTLSGIRLCKSYANEEFEEYKFSRSNSDLYFSRKKTYRAMGEFSAGTNLISDLMNLVIIIVGGLFAIRGIITTGDLVAYILYTTFFMRPVRQIVNMIQQLQGGLTGVERFYDIMTTTSDIGSRAGAIASGDLAGDIVFDHVDFSYGDDKPVLVALDLTIPHGKHIALVGPSGVGKSTIINLIPRFYDVVSGAIRIDNTDIRDFDLAYLRRNIGIVQQDVFMFHGSIKENILYGQPDADDDAVIRAAKQAYIYDFIASLPNGLDTLVGERGVKLSGGQKQRLSIARVFLKNPPIVILDEATSSLDNESETYVQRALDALAVGKTTITVAHRLTTVMNADQILVLQDNQVIERGTHDALIGAQGLYYKLYTAQFKGYLPDNAV